MKKALGWIILTIIAIVMGGAVCLAAGGLLQGVIVIVASIAMTGLILLGIKLIRGE